MINDNKCSNDDFKEYNNVDTKECIKCGKSKPSDTNHFHKIYDGTRNTCKICVSKYKKDYDSKVDKNSQEYQDKKEHYKELQKEYRRCNKDKINKKRREYYEIYGR